MLRLIGVKPCLQAGKLDASLSDCFLVGNAGMAFGTTIRDHHRDPFPPAKNQRVMARGVGLQE